MMMSTAFEYIERALVDPDPARQEDALAVLRLLEEGVTRVVMTVNDMNTKALGQEGADYLYGEDELRQMAEEVLRCFRDIHHEGWVPSGEERQGEPRVLRGHRRDVSPFVPLRTGSAVPGIA